MPKQRISISVDDDVAAVLETLSAKAGKPRRGAHGRSATNASMYVEALVRDRLREWRIAIEFLEDRGYPATTIAEAAEALRGVEEPYPARMAPALEPGLQALAEAVRGDPQVAGALFVVAREWWRHNPMIRAALVAEEAA